jgi:hypothetical protein
MAQLGDVESNSKYFVKNLNLRIAALQNQSSSNKEFETDLIAKVEKLFEETTCRMSHNKVVNLKLISRLTNPMRPII